MLESDMLITILSTLGIAEYNTSKQEMRISQPLPSGIFKKKRIYTFSHYFVGDVDAAAKKIHGYWGLNFPVLIRILYWEIFPL
jgi:hypothetical protein